MLISGEKLALYTAVMLQDQVLLQMLQDERYDDAHSTLKLTMAMRDAMSEVSTKHPVYVAQTVTAIDCVIPYSDLNGGTAATVVTRVTAGGRDVPYTVDSFGVHVGCGGTYTVVYTPETFEIELTDDLEVAPEVGFVMMIHLVARNYCMLSGRTEEAAMYDSRYNDYAETINLKRRAHIPARAFV